MIDMHSHIIPGIDDGSKDIDESIEMLKSAEFSGTTKIIATPHYSRVFDEPFNKVKKNFESLKATAKEYNINLELFLGQEVYISKDLVNNYKEGLIGTINNSKYMLIEFPMNNIEKGLIEMIYEIKLLNIQPIIAHPERYLPIIKNPFEINSLIDEGVLFQLNAGSAIGKFGKDVKKTSNILLDNNIYSFIGSDAHGVVSRTTNVSESIDYINENYSDLDEIFIKNSEKVLNNEDVFFMGNKIEKKKSIFNIFKK